MVKCQLGHILKYSFVLQCKYLVTENHDEIEQENESFGGKIFESL